MKDWTISWVRSLLASLDADGRVRMALALGDLISEVQRLAAERDALEFLACALFDSITNEGWREENVQAGLDQLRKGAAYAPIELVNAVRRCAGLEAE